jgi:hypothetical protein
VSFFLQVARIAAVGAIVAAAVILSAIGKFDKGETALLSSIAGFMLGGATTSTRSQTTNAQKRLPGPTKTE